MKKLLHIDSSANPGDSVSRRLTGEFVNAWLAENPGLSVQYRDLAKNHAPHITSDLLSAIYAPAGHELSAEKKNALAAANALIDEFVAADYYVFGVPMYNYAVPSTFKAYIDQIVRVGRTVLPGPKGLQGMLKDKRMLIISTRSGDYSKGGARDGWDFHEPYLRKVFTWIGIEDISYLPVMHSPREDTSTRAKRVEDARVQISAVFENWKSGRESNPARETSKEPVTSL